jgi:DNA segregation ATPase FtsK/SpoIIIE, S-DNA-T family
MKMGFIRKFVDYLLGYEVKEIIVEEPAQEEKKKQQQSPKKQPKHPIVKPSGPNGVKTPQSDLETRVAYQYPKGKFRFPLIDDNADVRQPRQEREEEREVRPSARWKEEENAAHRYREEEQPKRPSSRPSNRRRNHEVRPSARWKEEYEEQPVSNGESSIPSKERRRTPKQWREQQESSERTSSDHLKPKVEEEKLRTRPFRPTEIPSPIYGFNQRPDKKEEPEEVYDDDIIEFELPSSSPIRERREIEKKDESAYRAFPTFEEHLPPTQEEEIYMMNESEPLQKEKIVSYEETEQLEEVPSMYTHEAKEEVSATEEPSLYEEEEAPAPSFKNEIEDEQATQNSVSLSPIQEIEEERKEEETSSASVEDERMKEYEIKEPGPTEEKQTEAPVEEAHEQRKMSSDDREEKRKRHVPFNVMMLKKDRQELKKKVEKETILPTNEEMNERDSSSDRELEEEVNREYYQFPELALLTDPPRTEGDDEEWMQSQSELLNTTLFNFNVRASVVNVTQGPTVTRFEVQPEPGVKVSKVTNLTDDIKLSMAAQDIRMEAPIPGKNAIGIELPNRNSKPVLLKEILESNEFQQSASPLSVALGLDISGEPIVMDLNKMPHGLIAGATGSGKSVCINTIIVSLLYKAAPHEVKLMLIDPKMVELAPYNHIPHLVSPVITDAKAATSALKWAVEEMERRYELFAHTGVRDIKKYNELVEKKGEKGQELPYLVIIIDELADLMMVSPGEVEEAICRIAQKARACGIHLLLATQRPSVDVITGLIKANVPTRIAFSVSSQVDSRTIIDTAGAEKLLGKGDMLLLANGSSKSVRIQGNFVSDEEIDEVVQHVRDQMKPNYLFDQEQLLQKNDSFASDEDELFYEACEFVINQGGASTSSVQRRFRVGYNRAARLIDMMEEQGVISGSRGSKPRDVLMSEDELMELQGTSTF